MASEEHLQIIRQGVNAWNQWRLNNPELVPDLTKADLRCKVLDDERLYDPTLSIHANDPNLMRINLRKAILKGIDLTHACLHKADLREADLSDARLIGTNLCWAELCDATLIGADLHRANLNHADLTGARLRDANLERAILVNTTVSGAIFTGCRVYGTSAWDLVGVVKDQSNLRITDPDEPVITVDNIEVAQFIYLLLNNRAIRKVIDTITSKAVLILGRFSEERKPVLDAIRDELRKPEHNYLPIVFDFDVPENRDITETVSLLARMARFIIADLTDPSSIPKELEAIVPSLAVPVQPLLEGMARPYAMFKDYWKYDWVLPPYRYEGLELLLAALAEKVIAPAEAKVKFLGEKRRAIEVELTAPRTSA
jgi:Pentapeptide repeats (8 copies)